MKTTEHQHAKKVAQWARVNARKWPELELLYAIPNGGKRHVAVAAKLKAEGVKRGVPDYCLPVARGSFHGLYIELKAPNGKATPEQNWWLKRLVDQGYAAGICKGAEEAIKILTTYLGKQERDGISQRRPTRLRRIYNTQGRTERSNGDFPRSNRRG